MAGFGKARRGEVSPVAQDVDTTKCPAHGCPMRGTMDLGGAGKFFCHGHANTPDPQDWPKLTETLIGIKWLADLHAELARQINAGKPWINAACEFWQDHRDMHPTPFERSVPGAYLERLLGELWHMAGVRAARPAPTPEPKYPPKPMNNLPLRRRRGEPRAVEAAPVVVEPMDERDAA